MDRRSAILAYGTLGVACMALSLLLGEAGVFVIEGPDPLAFDLGVALWVTGNLFLVGAGIGVLRGLLERAKPDGGA